MRPAAAHTGPTKRTAGSDRVIPPDRRDNERLAEIGEILAAGLMRLRARKSSGLLSGEPAFSLETLPRQSGVVAEIEGDTP